MGNMKGSRPSPALVLAALALVFAMVGTAVAGPDLAGKLTKSKVKSIADKEIAKKAPGLTVANASNAASLGGVAAAGYQPRILSALVKADGTLVRGFGAVSSTRVSVGRYRVVFSRAVDACTLIADSTSATPVPGSASILGYAAAGPLTGDPNQIVVRVGNDSTPDMDFDFAVEALC